MTTYTGYMTTNNNASISATTGLMLDNVSLGAALTNKNTNLTAGTTQWVRVFPLGTGTAQTGAGAQAAPSDVCWVDSTTAIETFNFVAGVWSFALGFEMGTAGGTFIADFHFRPCQRTNAGVYTVIGEAIASGITIVSTGFTVVNASVSASASGTFAAGDKLALVVDMNITTNTTTSNMRMQAANSTTLGNISASLQSPGFGPAGGVTSIPRGDIGILAGMVL